MMKKILIDSSSAILLFKSGLFDDLIEKYQVTVTPSVYDELIIKAYPGAREFKTYFLNKKLSVSLLNYDNNLSEFPSTGSPPSLGKGERDTILQYIQGGARFIIIDDGKGAKYCKNHQIPYINALLVPRILYLNGEISETEWQRKRKMIIFAGRYAQNIIDYALTCSKESLAFFLP